MFIGSIEEVVENLVKEWEMQASHIEDTDTWSTISKTKYTLRVNEGSEVDGKEAAKIGNYNRDNKCVLRCSGPQKDVY